MVDLAHSNSAAPTEVAVHLPLGKQVAAELNGFEGLSFPLTARASLLDTSAHTLPTLHIPETVNGLERFHQFEIKSLRDSLRNSGLRGEALLTEYFRAYTASFPDPDEALTQDHIKAMVLRELLPRDVMMVTDGDSVVAGYHTSLIDIEGTRFSLGDYLWVAPDYRRYGLGKVFYDETMSVRQAQGAVAHIGEINDPFSMTPKQKELDATSGITPEGRIKFWSKMGRVAVDCPWFQPALVSGGAKVEHLILSIQPFGDDIQHLTRSQLIEIWNGFYKGFSTKIDISIGRERIAADLSHAETYSFIPLEVPRTHLR